MVVVNPYKTLIIGIQDLDSIPIGATLRVKQHANTVPKSLYRNVGNPHNWNNRGTISKIVKGIQFLRPWREPFGSYHFNWKKANELIRFLQQNQFERIILSEIWTWRYLQIVKKYAPMSKIVLDLHNVESKLQREIYESYPSLRNCWLSVLMKKAEEFFVGSVDEVWVCSEADKQILTEMYSGVICKVVPNVIDVSSISMNGYCKTHSIGYVGCFNYSPNEEAALFIMNEIVPRLDCPAHFIGKHPTDRMFLNSNIQDFFTGEVRNIGMELMKIRTLVLPIFTGSGTRFKVLEGMAYGIPIVATAKAVEGLSDMIPGIHYLRAEDEIEFELKIRWLWNNPSEEERIRRNARKLVEEKYSWHCLKLLNV